MKILISCSATALLSFILLFSTPVTHADSVKGKELFDRRCTGCHRLDEVRSGPRLRGIFGRKSGSDPSFPYSSGMKSLRITWDESTLDKWLADPESLVPDNDMAFRMSDAAERAQIIAYLKSLSTH